MAHIINSELANYILENHYKALNAIMADIAEKFASDKNAWIALNTDFGGILLTFDKFNKDEINKIQNGESDSSDR